MNWSYRLYIEFWLGDGIFYTAAYIMPEVFSRSPAQMKKNRYYFYCGSTDLLQSVVCLKGCLCSVCRYLNWIKNRVSNKNQAISTGTSSFY